MDVVIGHFDDAPGGFVKDIAIGGLLLNHGVLSTLQAIQENHAVQVGGVVADQIAGRLAVADTITFVDGKHRTRQALAGLGIDLDDPHTSISLVVKLDLHRLVGTFQHGHGLDGIIRK